MELFRAGPDRVYEPMEGWRRTALATHDDFNCELYEKPPGHASPMHSHDNEQISIVVEGHLTLHTDEGEYELGPNDAVRLDANETHSFENTGSGPAMGVDIFVPVRPREFWTDE
jgi:quercetin dioxygenase-like cupin family protein